MLPHRAGGRLSRLPMPWQHVSMLLGGGPGGALRYLAGIIKPGREVIAVLVWVVQAWGPGESHLLICCKEQGINGSCFWLGATMAGGLLQVC